MKLLFTFYCCSIVGILYVKKYQNQVLSNILTCSLFRFLSKPRWNIKCINKFYNEAKVLNYNGTKLKIALENFFTSSLELFSGAINNQLNLELLLEHHPNANQEKNFLAPFFVGIAPALKLVLYSLTLLSVWMLSKIQ